MPEMRTAAGMPYLSTVFKVNEKGKRKEKNISWFAKGKETFKVKTYILWFKNVKNTKKTQCCQGEGKWTTILPEDILS